MWLIASLVSIDVLGRVADILLVLSQDATPESIGSTLDLTIVVLKEHEASMTSSLLEAGSTSANAWFKVVESLWRCESFRTEVSRRWPILTSRILLWRSCSGSTVGTGEWVRREAITAWTQSVQRPQSD